MDDKMKNPDNSDEGKRRRGEDDADPDGREVADALYGGLDDSDESDDSNE